MGRYCQARHRGRGNAGDGPQPSPPAPPPDDVWTLTSDAFGNFFVTIVSGVCPVGVDGFDADVVDDDDPGISGLYQAAGCGFPITTSGSPGDHLHVRIRWTLDVTAVTDWSTVKSIVL